MEQTKPKNNLPKYWAVKNDGSQLFKDTVIKYINENYLRPNDCIFLKGVDLNYYGYEDHVFSYGGCSNNDKLEDFRNPVTELSIQEFIELSKPIEDSKTPYTDALNKLKEPVKWEPKYGEIVFASNMESIIGLRYMFVTTNPNALYPFICTHRFYGQDIGVDFKLIAFKNVYQTIKPKEYTIQEVAKALGEEVGNFTIKSE